MLVGSLCCPACMLCSLRQDGVNVWERSWQWEGSACYCGWCVCLVGRWWKNKEREYMLSLEQPWEELPQEGVQRPGSPLSLPGKFSIVGQHWIPLCGWWAQWSVLDQGATDWVPLKPAHRQLCLAGLEGWSLWNVFNTMAALGINLQYRC